MFWRDRFAKINQLIDFEKREKERIIAKRKQEYVLDLKRNFDDQVKIFNESLNTDRKGSKWILTNVQNLAKCPKITEIIWTNQKNRFMETKNFPKICRKIPKMSKVSKMSINNKMSKIFRKNVFVLVFYLNPKKTETGWSKKISPQKCSISALGRATKERAE